MMRTAKEWQRELEQRVSEKLIEERIERGCELCGEEFPVVYGYYEFAEMVLSHSVKTFLKGKPVTLAKGTVVFCHHEPCAYDHEVA